jgi:transposase
MGTAVLLRGDFNGASLRALAKKSKDGNRTRRLVAIAEIYDGGSRSDAARIGGVGLQTIRDWVLRFNARGPDGLVDGKAPGQRSKLSDDHRHVLPQWSRLVRYRRSGSVVAYRSRAVDFRGVPYLGHETDLEP